MFKPNTWNELSYNQFFESVGAKKYQIQKQDYLEEGSIPVVDQGQKKIAGFTENNDKILEVGDGVIVFGDHTRIVKYIDFNFAVGADGTQILKTKEGINLKFAYYQLLNKQIPDMGYSRHFKFVKEKKYYLPKNIEEQKDIVKILDDSKDMVRLRQECINYTEELIPAIFYQMFGDPTSNDKGFKLKKLGDLATHVSSGSTPRGGQATYLKEGITFIRSQNVLMNRFDLSDVAYISREMHDKMARSKVMEKDVLLNITGASIGRVAYYKGKDDTANVNQHVCIIRPKSNEILPEYLSSFISMPSYQEKIMMQQSGATRQAFNYQQIKKFDVLLPPMAQQEKFANIAREIDEYKKQQYQELKYAEDLFQSLLQKAFTGELMANKVY